MTTPLPIPPNRADSANFSPRSDVFMAALPTFQEEMIVLGETTQTNKNYVESAWNAAGGITVGLGQAVAAAAQASTARDAAIAAWASSTAPAETLAAMSQSLHSGAIVKSIIYDTSRDSDLGAWRKRCTHTSWYTETLGGTNWLGQKATAAAAWGTSGAVTGSYFQNTTDGKFYQLGASSPTVAEVFRGNVREFPALVAVVAETARVVIYDLTQPGAPMWMVVLTSPTGGWLNTRAIMNQSITSVAAFDGCVVIAQGVVDGGLTTFNFVSDTIIKRIASSSYGGRWSQGIGYRNTTGAYSNGTSTGYGGIIHPIVNDVALTTLPDAPIDPATGLPVPTIAVATAGGVSRIAHDGTVSSTSTANAITSIGVQIGCTPIYFIATFGTNGVAIVDARNPLPSGGGGDLGSYWGYAFAATWGSQFLPRPADFGALSLVSGGVAAAGTPGLLTRKPNPSLRGSGMVAAITNRYNSGWQVGDSRGAWLADTVAESITAGAELATNGTSPASAAGWTASAQGTNTVAVSGGEFVFTTVDGLTDPQYVQNISTVVGAAYKITVTGRTVGGRNVYAYAAGKYANIATGSNSTQTTNFIASSSSTQLVVAAGNNAGGVGYITSVSVVRIEADRSAKNNGLNIVGTLTKTAVASGAQLVAYSGFSTSNYLEQPYSANLDFGTGDFCVMGWAQAPSGNGVLFYRGDSASNTTGSIRISRITGAWSVSVQGVAIVSPSGDMPAGWFMWLFKRAAGIWSFSVNGVEAATNATGGGSNINIVNAVARVGYDFPAGIAATSTNCALLRITATAPSADQIAHIYRTELPLFQPGAQCTIAGTSTAVTALAYDDATDLLHAATSWGRSGFKDLIRVDSEATTVGALTSVSAQGGVVLLGGTSAKVYQPALLLRDELRRKAEAQAALGSTPVFFEFDTASFTSPTTSGSAALTASSIVGTPYVGMGITGTGIPAGTTLAAINGTAYTMSAAATVTNAGAVAIAQSSYNLQQGYEIKAVYSAGTLKRRGATKDYTVSDDGFKETATFGTSPGSAAWVSIMAVRK